MQAVVTTIYRALRVVFSSPRFWLVLILLLAWALRLTHLDTMSIWWDESLSYARATQDLPTILSNVIQIQKVTTRDLHPPLYFVLLHFAVNVFGTSEFGLRVLSAMANLLTIALMFPLVQVLLKTPGVFVSQRETTPPGVLPHHRRIGLLVALFAALSPFYVWYSQEARPYALVLLWSILALYALLKWLHSSWRTSRALVSPWLILFLAACGLTLVTHYLSFVLLPFYAAVLFLYGTRERSWRARLLTPMGLLAVLLLVGCATIFILIPGSAEALTGSEANGPQFVPFFIMLRDVWNSFTVGVTANLDEVALIDLLLVVLWVLGIASTVTLSRRTPRVDARLALVLLSFFLLPALALQFGSYLRPLYLNSRHLITISPAFYIGLALGVDGLAQRLSGRTVHFPLPTVHRRLSFIFYLSSLIFVVGAVYSLNNLYNNPAYAKDDHKAWSQFLRERMRPGDYLLLVAPQAQKIYEYYAPPGLKWQSLPKLVRSRKRQQRLDLGAVLSAYRNHPRVWLLELHQPVGDPSHHINDLLRRYGEPIDIEYFPGISTRIILQQLVYRSPRLDPKQVIAQPTQITFDDNLQLIGYDAPAQVRAAGHYAVQLYWQLMDKTPNELGVSLRVVDEHGVRWGQWDAPPVGNLYPTSKWEPGVTMVDQHDLVVDPGAPPGTYFIELSVFHLGGGEPVTAQANDVAPSEAPVRLATIEVLRPDPPRDPKNLIIDRHADVPFGDVLRYVGYDFDQKETGPGSILPLTLYFQLVKNPGSNVTGTIELNAPFWQIWNRTNARAPLTLDVQNRLAGDIVQARVELRLPGDANAGEYELRLALDGYTAQDGWLAPSVLTIGTTRVAPIERSTVLPAMSTRVNARLGDQVELLGYDLNAPQPLQPNDTLTLTLYWRALKTIDTSYTVFAHLIDSANKIFGQSDSIPVQAARPTTSWAPGEVLIDTHRFQVAPQAVPGLYQIRVGLYDAVTLKRLPTFDSNGTATGDRILLQELNVK